VKYRFTPSHLWVAVFVIGALFQWWRGSKGDFLIFGLIALLLTLALLHKIEIPHLAEPRFIIAAWWLALSTSIFMITPIHSLASTGISLFLLPLLLSIIWRKDGTGYPPMARQGRFTTRIWISIALLLSLSELGNYFGSLHGGGDSKFPTLTVLVDPIVGFTPGRIGFVFLWSLVGVELLKGSTER